MALLTSLISEGNLKNNSLFDSFRQTHKRSFDKDEERVLGKKNENIEIIEYEEFSASYHSINKSEILQTPIDKNGGKTDFLSITPHQNKNEKEFFIKHLLNEIKKYSTYANSYKTENEDLKEKIKFLMTKMEIKDQKIEEITKLLNSNKKFEQEKSFNSKPV